MPSTALAPNGLHCQLLTMPERTQIHTAQPRLGWIVRDSRRGARQTAYQIQVTTATQSLESAPERVWDSGRVESAEQTGIAYGGPPPAADSSYRWRVRTWNDSSQASPWSAFQTIHVGEPDRDEICARYPLQQTKVAPARVVQKATGHYWIDFGRDAFATLQLTVDSPEADREIEVRLGEQLSAEHTINPSPPGTIRYQSLRLALQAGRHSYVLDIPPDPRNTGDHAIHMPEGLEVYPFRYCELLGVPSPIDAADVRQLAVHYPFDDTASAFECSDETLNAVWGICKYSIKATSFCGVYVDGDRERIPYEADAYINQLCHYAVDREYSIARYTHAYLIAHPTWPTEWILQSVLIAWEDYMYSGCPDMLEAVYDDLRAKLLLPLAREDGLISTETGLLTQSVLDAIHIDRPIRDIVDWPPASFGGSEQGERDGYDMRPINTVVNCFHCRALALMSRIAAVLCRADDQAALEDRAARVARSINELLYDPTRGAYLDGEGSDHASLHANMLPLAFGLVPQQRRPSVVDWVKSRGMACSVYGAQFLLEGLYRAGQAEQALDLMTARHDRGWWHMIELGSTITLEAWDWVYKTNLDWNHAWGAAPANIIPRFLMGVRPLEAGFSRVEIAPQPGWLTRATLTHPTIRGPIHVRLDRPNPDSFALQIDLPANTEARVLMPRLGREDTAVVLDGRPTRGTLTSRGVAVEPVGSGRHTLTR